jgi:hypothetical protein
MPESSAKDGNLPNALRSIETQLQSHGFTSLWLDTGIHASVTAPAEASC